MIWTLSFKRKAVEQDWARLRKPQALILALKSAAWEALQRMNTDKSARKSAVVKWKNLKEESAKLLNSSALLRLRPQLADILS